jgi:hypothetical protein
LPPPRSGLGAGFKTGAAACAQVQLAVTRVQGRCLILLQISRQSSSRFRQAMPEKQNKHGFTLVQPVPVFAPGKARRSSCAPGKRGGQPEAGFYGTRAHLCCTDRRSRAHSAHSRLGTPAVSTESKPLTQPWERKSSRANAEQRLPIVQRCHQHRYGTSYHPCSRFALPTCFNAARHILPWRQSIGGGTEPAAFNASDRHCVVTVASSTGDGRVNSLGGNAMTDQPMHEKSAGQGRVMGVSDLSRSAASARRLPPTGSRNEPFLQRVRSTLHWNPGSLVPHAMRFPQERSVTPHCVQHRRVSKTLHNRTGVSCAPSNSHVATARGRSRNTYRTSNTDVDFCNT